LSPRCNSPKTSQQHWSLSATISQHFMGGMMPESANPMQQSVTVIEIRPFRGGWQCFEGPGVQPYWTGDTAKEDAIGYATARAKFGRGEIVFSITMARSRQLSP
jgi:hypothetical protein